MSRAGLGQYGTPRKTGGTHRCFKVSDPEGKGKHPELNLKQKIRFRGHA